jgi:hypothetical protein
MECKNYQGSVDFTIILVSSANKIYNLYTLIKITFKWDVSLPWIGRDMCTVWPKFNVTHIVLLGKLWTAYLMVQLRFQHLLLIEDTYTHFCLYLVGNFIHYCLRFTGWGHINQLNMPCTEAIKWSPERNFTHIWAYLCPQAVSWSDLSYT